MARKTLDELSPAYRRRIERGQAQGKTRQQARGHKAREHVERKQKEIAVLGITREQKRKIEDFVEEYNTRLKPIKFDESTNPDQPLNPDDIVEFARNEGYAAFVKYRTVWNRVRKNYINDVFNSGWKTGGDAYLDAITTLAGVANVSWLYYH